MKTTMSSDYLCAGIFLEPSMSYYNLVCSLDWKKMRKFESLDVKLGRKEGNVGHDNFSLCAVDSVGIIKG